MCNSIYLISKWLMEMREICVSCSFAIEISPWSILNKSLQQVIKPRPSAKKKLYLTTEKIITVFSVCIIEGSP